MSDLFNKAPFRLKFLLRTLINPVVTLSFLQRVATDSLLHHVALAQNTLPAKIHRPYLFAALPVATRAQAILEHYTFIQTLPSLPLRQALSVPTATRLCVLEGKNGERFEIKLSMSRFERG
ncbi:VirK/YbjX family protein [Candidatus Sodalis pierantonius]|uniref:VirK/YbjX family protein n=1 Tax=Candidatus Sodalis pierantonii TaxID=1486991 RepID=UPI00214E63EB|nr:VirK/YbjX family protein [Candidatus Sodalis pierantonius]